VTSDTAVTAIAKALTGVPDLFWWIEQGEVPVCRSGGPVFAIEFARLDRTSSGSSRLPESAEQQAADHAAGPYRRSPSRRRRIGAMRRGAVGRLIPSW